MLVIIYYERYEQCGPVWPTSQSRGLTKVRSLKKFNTQLGSESVRGQIAF